LPYAPEEVGAVYLGCKIANDDKEEIIEITRRLYAQAKLYQAEKHPREFALIFAEITSVWSPSPCADAGRTCAARGPGRAHPRSAETRSGADIDHRSRAL